MTGTERYQSCSCMGPRMMDDVACAVNAHVRSVAVAPSVGLARQARSEEEERDGNDSQMLLASDFPAATVEVKPEARTPIFSRKLLETAIWLLLLLLLWTMNLVIFKRTSTVLKNYSLFLTLIRVALQLPFYFAGYMFRLHYQKALTRVSPAADVIFTAELSIPLWKFFAMGTLDSWAGVLQTAAAGRIAGSLQALLQQSAIPLTMVLSLLIIRARYRIAQWLGAAVILGGVVLVLWPTLSDPSRSALAWSGVYLLAIIPNSCSNLWKEITFKHVVVDLWHLQTMVCIGQLIAGVAMAPLASLIPPVNGPSHLMRNQLNAVLCVAGHNSYADDECHTAGVLLAVYLTINFVFNIALLGVLRTSSATVVTLASALRLPISNVAFTWRWLMGNLAQTLNKWDWIGMAVILIGIFLYSFLPPLIWTFLLQRLAKSSII